MNMRDLMTLLEAHNANVLKFWFNARTKEVHPVLGNDYHYDMIDSSPKVYNVDPSAVAHINASYEGHDASDKLLQAAMENGWARCNAVGADGSDLALVHCWDWEDARECIRWMIKNGMVSDSVEYETVNPQQHGVLRDKQINQFLRTGLFQRNTQ